MIEVIDSSNRAAWLKARRPDVTASVVGALFGAHPYTTAYELWARKSGRLRRSDEDTPAMRRGRYMEHVAVMVLKDERPDWIIEHNAAENRYFRDPAARIGATPDVIATAPGRGRGVVQIKSVGEQAYRRGWLDDDGNPEAPLWIALQAAVEAYVTEAEWAAVAPLVVGHGLEMPLIEIDLPPGLIAAIKARVADFWALVESGDEPSLDLWRDGPVLDAMYPFAAHGQEIDLTGNARASEIVEQRAAAVRRLRDAEAEKTAMETAMKALLREAAVGHLAGGLKVYWSTQRRRDPATGRMTSHRILRFPRITQEDDA